MLLRDATPKDKQLIQELFAAELAHFGYTPNPELDRDILGFPGTYQSGCFCLLELDGLVVAMGGVLDGELRRVFVRPTHRGRGLGKAIVANLIVRSTKPLTAVIRKDNPTMQHLVQQFGFRLVGTHPTWDFCNSYLLD